MTDTVYTSYGIWGSGEADPGNADALLRDFIADDLGTVFRPERVPRGTGLKTAVDWFEDPELLGKGGTVATDDMLGDLTRIREEEGDRIVLIVLWPSEPTQEDSDFVAAFMGATVGGSTIRIVDLSQALDDLTDITPKPAEKASTRRVRTPRAETEANAEAEAPKTPEVTESKPPRKGRKLSDAKASVEDEIAEAAATMAAIEARQEPAKIEIATSNQHVVTNAEFEVNGSAVTTDLMNAIDAYIEFKVDQVIQARLARDSEFRAGGVTNPCTEVDLTEGINQKDRDRPVPPKPFGEDEEPPFDGPYQDGVTVSLWMTEDGDYRLADKTRPRRGEVKAEMSEGEVENLRAGGRLK